MQIDIRDMSYGYGNDSKVLQDIVLSMDRPGLVCIVGPNGVGKSTLVRCINKILTPCEGIVEMDGRSLKDISFKELSKHIGYVPVSSDDFFPMTVLETVLIGRHPHSRWGSINDEDMRVAYENLKTMGMMEYIMRNFGELSAGQHQKVMIARGLAQEPEVLILDEPTSNLDIRHQLIVTEHLRRIALEKNMLVIMVSHDLNIASRYADEVILMAPPGIVYRSGTPEEVFTEEIIRDVYGVETQIIMVRGRPHIVLLDAIPDNN